MGRCHENLGYPPVTFDTFWEVYLALRNEVEATIPLNVITSLNQSILNEPGGDGEEGFAMAHMEAPELDSRNVVEVDEDEDEDGIDEDEEIDENEEIDEDEAVDDDEDVDEEGEEEDSEEEDLFLISFTMDADKDQLY